MTKITPIVSNTDTFSTAADAIVKQAAKGPLTKLHVLNIIAAAICGPKYNWGFLKGLKDAFFAKGIDRKDAQEALGVQTQGNTSGESIDFFVVVYEHAHGADRHVFWTEEEVELCRQNVAEEWWDSVFTDRDFPEDRERGADEYFAKVEDLELGEYFSVQKASLPARDGVGAPKQERVTDYTDYGFDDLIEANTQSTFHAVKALALETFGSMMNEESRELLRDKLGVEADKAIREIISEAADEYAQNYGGPSYMAEVIRLDTDKEPEKAAVVRHIQNYKFDLLTDRLNAWTADKEVWQEIFRRNEEPGSGGLGM